MSHGGVLVRGDARRLPIRPSSVDLVIGSPPYFCLRDYEDGGASLDGQVGAETDPADYLRALWDVVGEVTDAMKPGASLFWNMGDKYVERAGPGRTARYRKDQDAAPYRKAARPARRGVSGVRAKSLLGLPWAFALGCTGMLNLLGMDGPDLGLLLRAEIIWQKPNALPEAPTDRVARSHEHWFHFVKQPTYDSGIDEIREPYAEGTAARYAAGYGDRSAYDAQRLATGRELGGDSWSQNPRGKVPRSVWSIPTESLVLPHYFVDDETQWNMLSRAGLWRYVEHRVDGGNVSPVRVTAIDHFAAFPTEWPRRLIKGWSPNGVCLACGEGRWPVVDGYACACWSPGQGAAPSTRSAVVLDPFSGTGTTVLTARALGRIGVGVDLSMDYLRLARWRVWKSGATGKVRARDGADAQVTLPW